MTYLSNTHLKAIDRAGGAYLALPWPADLPAPTLAVGEEQRATAAQHLAAARLVAPIAMANGLVHIATLAAHVEPPRNILLLAHVVTPRWQAITRPGARGRVLYGAWSASSVQPTG